MTEVIEIDNYAAVSNNLGDIYPEKNVDCSITYNEFFNKFLMESKPCVFRPEITGEWRCRCEWNASGAPNFQILLEVFGDCEVPVADCKKKLYNSQLRHKTTVENYLKYWTEYRDKDYPDDMPNHYLKDWHCVSQWKSLDLYKVPKYFASDWLNEYYIAHPEFKDDYMFVYMGPKNTWTPFHVDVLTSNSWSANIVGRKRWILIPPGEENSLCDSHNQLPFDLNSEDLKNRLKYPNYDENTLKSFEIIQEEGEIIFVPSGWHHQVWNLEDTISVNHNWINGCNIENVWLSLKKELSAVMREVEDCRDMKNWEKHCQLMLKASYGMNYPELYFFLSFIIERRLNVLKGLEVPRSFDTWKFGSEHCFFDLNRARIVLKEMINDAEEKNIFELVFPDNNVNNLIDNILEILPQR